MPSFKRQIERKVFAQAAIRQIKNFIIKIWDLLRSPLIWHKCPFGSIRHYRKIYSSTIIFIDSKSNLEALRDASMTNPEGIRIRASSHQKKPGYFLGDGFSVLNR
jgi:hypothetical protein